MLKRIGIFVAIVVASFAFLVFVAPKPTFAHGGGPTFTATTTAGYIDIDYEAYFIEAGVPGRFDFKLFKDEARTQPIDFTQVWARIVRGDNTPEGQTFFSGWIPKSSFGTTGFTVLLPESGPYNLAVRYNNGDKEIVQAVLSFNVDPSTVKKPFTFDRTFWIGFSDGAALLIALFGAYLLVSRRRR